MSSNNSIYDKKIELAQQKIDRYREQMAETEILIENEERMIDHWKKMNQEDD